LTGKKKRSRRRKKEWRERLEEEIKKIRPGY
jgi:hypothetical protein